MNRSSTGEVLVRGCRVVVGGVAGDGAETVADAARSRKSQAAMASGGDR